MTTINTSKVPAIASPTPVVAPPATSKTPAAAAPVDQMETGVSALDCVYGAFVAPFGQPVAECLGAYKESTNAAVAVDAAGGVVRGIFAVPESLVSGAGMLAAAPGMTAIHLMMNSRASVGARVAGGFATVAMSPFLVLGGALTLIAQVLRFTTSLVGRGIDELIHLPNHTNNVVADDWTAAARNATTDAAIAYLKT